MEFQIKQFNHTVPEVGLINKGEKESFEVNIPDALLDSNFSRNRFNYLTHSDKELFFLFIEGVPVGYIIYKVSFNRQPKYGHVISIYISKKHRGNCYSDKLINFVLARLFDEGITILRLEVTANNEAAIKSYERNGFKVARLEMEFIRGDN